MQITLKAARVNAGLTQQQVEASSGISRSSLYRWESGKGYPNLKNLVKLCELYEVPVEWFREGVPSGSVTRLSEEEGYLHVILGLISYHERMTMGGSPEKDYYLNALRFALECMEEKISKEENKNGMP